MKTKILYLIFTIVWTTTNIFSQNPVGFYGYGGNYSWANHLSMNSAGNLFAMVGTVSGPKEHLLVTDNLGNVVLSKKTDKTGEFFSSAIDNDGSLYVVGGAGSIGSYSKHLMRLTSSGVLTYSKGYGNGQLRYVLTDGNYLLATGFEAKWNPDYTGKIGMPCILKLNKSDGSIVWYKEYKINGSEYVDSYVIRKLGTNYYITGTFNGGGNKSYILCVKESDGSVVWCKTYSTTTSPNFTGMSIDNSNLVVCGVSNNRGFDGDLYVLNVNPSNGNVIWQRKIEKAAGWHYNTMDGDSWGINCVIDPYGDVVIAYEDNPSFDGSSPQRGGLLAKLKMTDGTTKWVKKYRTSDGDGFHGLVISDCNYVASGWFHSTDYNYGLVISDSAGYVGGTYGTLVTKTNSSNSFSEVDVTSTTTVSSLSTNANLSISLSDVSISTSTKKSGSSPTCAIPLPVELLSFTGTPERAGNLLEWVTASETSNAYFEVQATKDGQHFETIGRVNGAGNSTERIAYSFLDRNPSAEIMYYRLKQVDYDGAESIHNIISIKRTFGKDITLYPNPSKNILNIEFDAEWSGTYVVSFVSTDGRMINKDIHVETGKNSVQINVNDKLSDGFYQMRLLDEEGNLLGVKKFIKE